MRHLLKPCEIAGEFVSMKVSSCPSFVLLLFLLLTARYLRHHDGIGVSPVLAAPSIPHNDLNPEGKFPVSTMIKTGTVSSVNRRGGGGHGSGGRGGRGRGGGGEGGGRGGAGSMIPLYAGGAAGAGAHGHHNGAALNRGKPNPIHNLGLALLLALPLLFKFFA
ncbi:unnamed protein product [Linum tenue]|uniref:Glycine-rich protein n=1 Tax=Linum tenue TaxID=586396 RepID=A0AAV0QIZ2_9ROSI|nr:unnamed protein product [Linum tenue]